MQAGHGARNKYVLCGVIQGGDALETCGVCGCWNSRVLRTDLSHRASVSTRVRSVCSRESDVDITLYHLRQIARAYQVLYKY